VLDEKIAKELKKIVGDKNYLDTPEDLMNYSYDAFTTEARPEAVLLPLTTEQVSDIMKVAYREKIPVTPRGAGTNISGGSVPMRKGVVLAFTRMVWLASGFGSNLHVISVMIPRVPSEPAKNPTRSIPVTFFVVRPPTRIICPFGNTTVRPRI